MFEWGQVGHSLSSFKMQGLLIAIRQISGHAFGAWRVNFCFGLRCINMGLGFLQCQETQHIKVNFRTNPCNRSVKLLTTSRVWDMPRASALFKHCVIETGNAVWQTVIWRLDRLVAYICSRSYFRHCAHYYEQRNSLKVGIPFLQ